MEKRIHHEDHPKRPIGRKQRPNRATDYEPDPAVVVHLQRMGMRFEMD